MMIFTHMLSDKIKTYFQILHPSDFRMHNILSSQRPSALKYIKFTQLHILEIKTPTQHHFVQLLHHTVVTTAVRLIYFDKRNLEFVATLRNLGLVINCNLAKTLVLASVRLEYSIVDYEFAKQYTNRLCITAA